MISKKSIIKKTIFTKYNQKIKILNNIMIKININNKIFDFDCKILKFSKYLKKQTLDDEGFYNLHPQHVLNLVYTTEETFDLFNDWFEEVCKNYLLAKYSKCFYSEIFEDLSVEELLDVFDFSEKNEINLLAYTVAGFLNNKCKFYKIGGKYYCCPCCAEKTYSVNLLEDNKNYNVNLDSKNNNQTLYIEKDVIEVSEFLKSNIDKCKNEWYDNYTEENIFENVCKTILREHPKWYNKNDLYELYKVFLLGKREIYNSDISKEVIDGYYINTEICNDLSFSNSESVCDSINNITFDNENIVIHYDEHYKPRCFEFTFEKFISILEFYTKKQKNEFLNQVKKDLDVEKMLQYDKIAGCEDFSENSVENSVEDSSEDSSEDFYKEDSNVDDDFDF